MGKEYLIRCSENSPGVDPSIGRRISCRDSNWDSKVLLLRGFKNDCGKFNSCKGVYTGKNHSWVRRNFRSVVLMISMTGFLFLLDSFMFSMFDSAILHSSKDLNNSYWPEANVVSSSREDTASLEMYGRLLNLASNSLAEKEFRPENSKSWDEAFPRSSVWKPCADKITSTKSERRKIGNGYIMVSANGGLNQQRVAICNSVAAASLLNATLVLPRFLYSNVWNDPSQFGDIYQEDYFVEYLKDYVNIVKDLPSHFKSLDIEKIGSLITDADLAKEAKPADYIRNVLPILKKNGVVHLFGYGNRLGFDLLPSDIQRLRCKCNFHALKFVPKIQQAGSLLVKRIRRYESSKHRLEKELIGEFMPNNPSKFQAAPLGPLKYLALHMRFEEDMVAYSQCDFGGGEKERRELQDYRKVHFPLLLERLKKLKPISPWELRKLGKCPLTPEEAALVLAGLSFKRGTYIYLAGSEIYGGKSRMRPLTDLYPNLVTKEMLLTPDELAPFKKFSSQLAALDFIACAMSDVFAMTDSGSQLSSLVSGFRTYYGEGRSPTLRPNKKRLAAILSESKTIEWKIFEDRVKKMISEGLRVHSRGFGKSIYRQPKCPECMCRSYQTKPHVNFTRKIRYS